MDLRTHIDLVSSQIIENFEAIGERFLNTEVNGERLITTLVEQLIASGSLSVRHQAIEIFHDKEAQDCLYGLFQDIKHIFFLRSRSRKDVQSVNFRFRPAGVDIEIALDPAEEHFMKAMIFTLKVANDEFETLSHVVHCDQHLKPKSAAA